MFLRWLHNMHAGGAKPKAKPRKRRSTKTRCKENKTEALPRPITNQLFAASMEGVVLMPRLSDTMTEGVIAGWHKNVGDAVKKGEVLADIETDKATMELESYKDGVPCYTRAPKPVIRSW
jgi:pyruvate dehydrogenase E2 component (dihydrolipoamide acetyltransferase)